MIPLLSATLSEHPDVERVITAGKQSIEKAVRQSNVAVGCWAGDIPGDQESALSAISAGVPYISACDTPEAFQALGELRSRATAAGALVLAGMSWSPGLTNLMAMRGAAALDESKRVRVAWVGSSHGAGRQEIIKWAMGALNGVAMIFEGNTWVLEEAGGREEDVFFPEPVGWRRVHLCAAPEAMSLPSTLAGVQHVVVKGALAEVTADQMVRGVARYSRSGSTSSLVRWAEAVARAFPGPGSPAHPWSALRVDVTGTKDGSEQTITYGIADQLPNLIVAPLSVAALTIGERMDGVTGVVSPETVFDPRQFFGYLGERGVRLAALHREG